MVSDIRKKCNKAVSNMLGKLVSAGKEQDAIRKGIKVERKPNLDFADWLYSEKGPIKTMKQRAVNQEAKKIITKDDVKRLDLALIAFNVAWKKV
jgi:predicted nucleic-acid-binding protein